MTKKPNIIIFNPDPYELHNLINEPDYQEEIFKMKEEIDARMVSGNL